jgi:D-glycero-alpha-D-manno-heptose-7-phosphate kinase
VEREDLAIAGGKQDQYATVFGGFNLIEFTVGRVLVTPLRLGLDLVSELESHLMLCYTGKVRPDLGLVDAQVRSFGEARPEAVSVMRRLHEMVGEMKEALLKGRLTDFGELLEESFLAKRRMNPGITDARIDEMYEAARKNGAIGGKLLGAGGGGYLLLFVEGRRRRDVRRAMEELGGQLTGFSFAERGMHCWRSTCP